EATALVLGARLLARQARGEIPSEAERAIAKIRAVLPGTAAHLDRLERVIQFWRPPRPGFDLDDPRLVALQEAVENRQVVVFRYHGRRREEETQRIVEPAALWYGADAWYVEGRDRMRDAVRAFRLDRVDDLRVTSERFVVGQSVPPSDETTEVVVRFA